MADLTEDTTAKDIVADIARALAEATVAGVKVFARVLTVDDLAKFQRLADPLPGAVAGVITRPPRREPGASSGEAYIEVLQLEVALRLSVARSAGEDESAATAEMHRLAGLVKKALSADITRGGRCHAVMSGGRLINRTELRGEPRIVSRPNQAFYVAALPVVCAWSVAE